VEDPRELVGTWALQRWIDDRHEGTTHRVDGVLELSRDVEGLRWEEALVWHRPDGDVEAHRVLLLRLTDDGWWVRFADGRDFHPWRPGESVTHPCRPDTYTGVVEGSVERWTVVWHASGPAKDYTMTSVLTPHGPVTR
jgi:hypothetical protein